MFLYVGISAFKSLRAGSQVSALLILFFFVCVILHNMWSGKSLQCCASCPLVFLSAISMFVKIMLAVCM